MRAVFMLLLFGSCGINNSQSKIPLTPGADRANAKITCWAVQNVEAHLERIKDNAGSYIEHQEDECLLTLLDTLGRRAINEKRVEYLAALDEICKVSDGYVSEALMEVAEAQYVENADLFI